MHSIDLSIALGIFFPGSHRQLIGLLSGAFMLEGTLTTIYPPLGIVCVLNSILNFTKLNSENSVFSGSKVVTRTNLI